MWGYARTAVALLAALAVVIAPMDSAQAARSGSRMGGMGQRRAPPPPRARAAPQGRSGPNINIGVAPMIGGPMYSPPMFGGGFFGPSLLFPPIIPFGGFGGGPSTT